MLRMPSPSFVPKKSFTTSIGTYKIAFSKHRCPVVAFAFQNMS